jgi:hypothetical protein
MKTRTAESHALVEFAWELLLVNYPFFLRILR